MFVEQQTRRYSARSARFVAEPCAHDNESLESILAASARVANPADLLPWKHPIVARMPNDVEPNELNLRIRIDSDEERGALEQALLRARATELAEHRRKQVRLSAGYGDSGTRETMAGEAGQAQLRWTMLDRFLEALRKASGP